MTFAHRLAGLALAGCCLAPASAAAQPRGRGAQPGTALTGSLYGGYDTPLFRSSSVAPSPTPGTPAPFRATSQVFGGADANLTYSRPGRRVGMSAGASASTRYYPDFRPSTVPSYVASATIFSAGPGRWQWSLGQSALYAPLSALSLFAGTSGAGAAGGTAAGLQVAALAGATNFQISNIRQVDLNTNGQIWYSLSRRTHASFLSAGSTQLQLDSDLPRAVRYEGRLRLSRDLTRGLRAYVGYGLTENRLLAKGSTPGGTSRIDGYDFGIDFSRPFQLTRDTSVGLSTGVVKVPDTGSKTYQLIGTASLDHRIGRRWLAQLTATRDARFVQAYRDAVVFNGVSAQLGGQLFSRIGSSVSANYSSGDINASAEKVGFNSYSGAVNLRYDIRRLAGVFAEYSIFRSKVDASNALAGYPTGTFGRHGVRVGLAFGLSPFSRSNRP